MFEEIQNSDIVQERALLVGIYGPETPRIQAEEYLDELEMLTRTAGGITIDKVLQNRMHPDPSTYIGSGKLRELKQMVSEHKIDTLIFDDDLSPTQIRNIEDATKAKLLDRSGLILDIFASRAQTAAAKTQVELAQLQYLLPRLTRFWTHLSRQQGGIGTRGPGETQIETDRRLIDKRIANLKDKLEKLDRQRTTQRKGRSENVRISLVGYTNAGKSTLMNALTDTEVLAEDRLFATLDSTVRRCEIANYDVLLSDTVGFIRKLPHDLIESFKSTLDEVREADILLHVVDASALMLDDYIQVVNDTLEDMNATGNKKIQLVFNKIDILEPRQIVELKKQFPEAVFVSAERNIGLLKLEKQIRSLIEEDFVTETMRIPAAKYEGVAFLHREANILEKKYVGSDVKLTFSIAEPDLMRLKALLDDIDTAESVV
ncbi:GTP-binding protein HflX [Fodinibius roseus]|uniref:GTPase HflX n=1 Tax=Fodinibius roseus TaxID=1194090 RepID=A0A1M4YDY0_9BACT|nr:GTPase HflX [Fodinibius roseus]SHF03666.1 GTP-binding protein HflX [Fodinibius roseus]